MAPSARGKTHLFRAYWTKGQLDCGGISSDSLLMPDASSWIGIVDDDPSVLKALTRLLRTRAFHVRTYGSAEAFLEALPDGLPACLILDLQMPAMSGLEFMQHLAGKKIRIPIIVITAYHDTELSERCKSAGALAILRKPLQDTSLFAAIDNASRGSDTPN